jgi:hypothetical protein
MFSMPDHFWHDPGDSSSEGTAFGEQRVRLQVSIRRCHEVSDRLSHAIPQIAVKLI